MAPPIKKNKITTTPPKRITRGQTEQNEGDVLSSDRKTINVVSKPGASKEKTSESTEKPQPGTSKKIAKIVGMKRTRQSLEMFDMDSSNDDDAPNTELLKQLNEALSLPPTNQPETGYTWDDLNQFLLNSTLNGMFPFVLEIKSTTEIFKRLSSAIFKMESVQLDELLDLFHLALMLQNYQRLEPHMIYRFELMDAVCELSVELLPQHSEFIGNSLCDRFVMDTNMNRLDKVIDMQKGIVMMIQNGKDNCHIAMTTLLAMLSKVSGVNVPNQETDVISKAFEMVKLVDWMQLVVSKRVSDMFVLVRSFSVIINTKENRSAHVDWDRKLGREIYHFFMKVLRTVRSSINYNFFEMMIERYIAFCVIRGVTEHAYDPIDVV